MKFFLKIGNYIFHPLWMPFLGALIYFLAVPRFFPLPVIEAKLFAIVILSIFIPIIFAFLLKSLKLTASIYFHKTKERRLPLLFFGLMLSTINNFILHEGYPELSYFFSGVLFSTGIAFGLSFINWKVSWHTAGLSALLTFVMGLSLLYNINLIFVIGILVFGLGWTASSRLAKTPRSSRDLILGVAVGVLPQLLFIIAGIFHYKM